MARKVRKLRTEKKAVLIALEDTKSSRYYFEGMIRDFNLWGRIVFARHIGTNPERVLGAITGTRSYKTDYERCWIVFDRDDWTRNSFDGTIEKARELGVCCAFSNECYELWLLLHFEKVTEPLHRKELNRRLNQYFHNAFRVSYQKSISDVYAILKSRQKVAFKYAKQLKEMHLAASGVIDPYEQNPLTYIFELVACLQAIGAGGSYEGDCYPGG